METIENGEVAGFNPRADRAAEAAEITECLVATEREGFEPLVAKYRAEFG